MTDPFDSKAFAELCIKLCIAYGASDDRLVQAEYKRLQAYCRRVSAPKHLDFPEIDSSLLPDPPSVIAAERLGYESFDYCERS